MINVAILVAMLPGSILMVQFPSMDACQAVMAGLPPVIAAEAECLEIEVIAPGGSRLAPELSPLPPRKAGQPT